MVVCYIEVRFGLYVVYCFEEVICLFVFGDIVLFFVGDMIFVDLCIFSVKDLFVG